MYFWHFYATQHLLNLYVQEDGTLDPRFHESFTTEWNANKNYIWDTSAANMYDKDESIVGTELKKGDLAIKFVMLRMRIMLRKKQIDIPRII